MENQRSWLFCAVIILINLFLLASTFRNSYDHYMESYSMVNIVEYVTSYIHLTQMLTAPPLTYVFLLRNLHKRYAVLNQLLRYTVFPLAIILL